MVTIHLANGKNEATCAVKTRSRWSFLAVTSDITKITCRNCSGKRRVSSYPRDTRSNEIKKLLKKEFPFAVFTVKIDKYSMGESINVRTNAYHTDVLPDPRGFGYIREITKENKAIKNKIHELLYKYESVDRDQWGEILSGGNTYLFIEEL